MFQALLADHQADQVIVNLQLWNYNYNYNYNQSLYSYIDEFATYDIQRTMHHDIFL